MKPSESQLPDDYNKLVSPNRCKVDDPNPRPDEQEGVKEKVEDIQQRGGVYYSPIAYKKDGVYWILDGWQRYRAFCELGWTEIPLNVKETSDEAAKASSAADVSKPLTPYQRIEYNSSLYDRKVRSGMDREDAIDWLVEHGRCSSRTTAERHVKVSTLPDNVLLLVKRIENRSEEEWDDLRTYDNRIKSKSKRRLALEMAEVLAGCWQDIVRKNNLGSIKNEERLAEYETWLTQVAVRSLNAGSNHIQKEFIRTACREGVDCNLDSVWRDVTSSNQQDSNTPGKFSIPNNVTLDDKAAGYLREYTYKQRKDKKEVVEKALNSFAYKQMMKDPDWPEDSKLAEVETDGGMREKSTRSETRSTAGTDAGVDVW